MVKPQNAWIPSKSRLFLMTTTAVLLAWGTYAKSPARLAPAAPSTPPQVGTFPATWIHGEDCATEPEFQVHPYNANLYILRQTPCADFEAPFLYMIFGTDKVLLLDTGSAASVSLEPVVTGVINTWLAANNQASIHLVVAHSHAHVDHRLNDDEFVGRPNTTLVSTNPQQMRAFWGFANWPTDQVTYDLGGRVLDILATPGHSGDCITLYDPETQLLLTGDTIYPGRLYIFGAQLSGAWGQFKDSISRLANFATTKPVTWVVGCHIEMTSTPKRDFPIGSTLHRNEHVLELDVQTLFDLNLALASEPTARPMVFDHFIVNPSY